MLSASTFVPIVHAKLQIVWRSAHFCSNNNFSFGCFKSCCYRCCCCRYCFLLFVRLLLIFAFEIRSIVCVCNIRCSLTSFVFSNIVSNRQQVYNRIYLYKIKVRRKSSTTDARTTKFQWKSFQMYAHACGWHFKQMKSRCMRKKYKQRYHNNTMLSPSCKRKRNTVHNQRKMSKIHGQIL